MRCSLVDDRHDAIEVGVHRPVGIVVFEGPETRGRRLIEPVLLTEYVGLDDRETLTRPGGQIVTTLLSGGAVYQRPRGVGQPEERPSINGFEEVSFRMDMY